MMCGMNVAPNKSNVNPAVYTFSGAVSGNFIIPPHNAIKVESYGCGGEGGGVVANGNLGSTNTTWGGLHAAGRGGVGVNAGGTQAGGAGGTASGGNDNNTAGTAGNNGTASRAGFGGGVAGPAGGASTANVTGNNQPGIAGNAWGGGGSGSTDGTGAGGGGGGGGGFVRSIWANTQYAPGQSVAYASGSGGSGASNAGNGADGANVITIS